MRTGTPATSKEAPGAERNASKVVLLRLGLVLWRCSSLLRRATNIVASARRDQHYYCPSWVGSYHKLEPLLAGAPIEIGTMTSASVTGAKRIRGRGGGTKKLPGSELFGLFAH